METTSYRWITTGDDFAGTVLSEIGKARDSIRLEMYIFMQGEPGDQVREALTAAAQKGVKVKVLLDAFGSLELPSHYWASLAAAGGMVRYFNPLALNRIAFRDHRKLVIMDERRGIVSGFNISTLETGDGIASGWRDLGLWMDDAALARGLTASFDRMFTLADFKHKRLARLPFRRPRPCLANHPCARLLTSGPGQAASPIKKTLLRDLQHARHVRIISAYFLPPRQIRRALLRSARRGNEIRIITAGRTDVRLARYAGRALYQRLLRAGIRISEYDAQILHTKLIIADQVVYIGSANLDTRSLNINYELLIRLENQHLAEEARQIFMSHLEHSRTIDRHTWGKSRGFWEKLAERLSHFLLARIDPLFARRQLTTLR